MGARVCDDYAMTNNNDTFHFNSFGQDFDLVPRFETYANGNRVALSFWYEEKDGDFSYWAPFAKVTVNMPEVHLNEGEILVKDYSENAELVEALVAAGWLIRTGREVSSGYIFPSVMRLGGPLLEEFNS
jgi:hypothetical protein